jgi:hypothetical protein
MSEIQWYIGLSHAKDETREEKLEQAVSMLLRLLSEHNKTSQMQLDMICDLQAELYGFDPREELVSAEREESPSP